MRRRTAACGPWATLALLLACKPAPVEDTDDSDPPPATWATCFPKFASGEIEAPDYDPFAPTLGQHCSGTNHQDIDDIERVVFLGDSVTVGTPPNQPHEFYRTRLAKDLADEFGLVPPEEDWQRYDASTGRSRLQESGDFASCAEWGARTRHLDDQIEDCFPDEASRAERTLVVMTMGGNDLQGLTEGFVDGQSHEALWDQTHDFMADMREAVAWLKAPERFPAGVFVIFTNLYEFTDATGDTGSCPAAEFVGLGEPVTDPELPKMVVWAMEEFMSIAVDTDTDMLFLLEAFCGHGFHHDDPESPCYLGPDAEIWFDGTCTHPNPTGHEAIEGMFLDVVRE